MPAKPSSTIPIATPFDYAKLMEGRIALEFPSSVIKEEKVTESYDKKTAQYTVSWYTQDDSGKDVAIAEDVSSHALDVIDEASRNLFSVSVSKPIQSKFTSQITVTYKLKKKNAAAAAEDTELDSGVAVAVRDSAYRIVSRDTGTTWLVLNAEGEEVDSDVASVPEALALLLRHVLVDLSYIEEVSGGKSTEKAQEDLDRAFLGALATWYVNSPIVNKEAKKHLVALVELVTKRDFKAMELVEE